MNLLRWLGLLVTLLLGLSAPAAAQPSAAAVDARATSQTEAPVFVLNRQIGTFRAPLFGVAPAERARRTERRLAELLERVGPGKVTVQTEPQGKVVLVDGALAIGFLPADVDVVSGETLDAAVANAQRVLAQTIVETREGRSEARRIHAVVFTAAGTLALLLAVILTLRIRQWLVLRLSRVLADQTARVRLGGTSLFDVSYLFGASRWLVRVLTSGFLALLVYRWTSFSLGQFPYTRPWGEELNGFLLGVAYRVGSGILSALPDLLIAFVIFVLARVVIGATGPLFDGVRQGRFRFGWLDPDTAHATRRMFGAVVWIFALVMAYPYLPGSGSAAFQGVSVLVGVMVTLGGSSLFGQAASGLILLYSRTVRVGEYVRIAEHEGTISELSAFTIKIRSGLGEEITLPNAFVLGTVTTNYSRPARGVGFVLDTTVTIGYDAPWRQVQAMLIEGAARTPGVVADPAPAVFQTALSDYYVEYRLVCQALQEKARPRAEALAALHANVLDVFNEHGVQIMSPHYLSDPAEPKVVPKTAWYAAPAQEPSPEPKT